MKIPKLEMNVADMNLPYYGIYVNSLTMNYDWTPNITMTLEIQLPADDPNLERAFLDFKLIEKIRSSNNISVKDQFDKLLTVMALTNEYETTDKK